MSSFVLQVAVPHNPPVSFVKVNLKDPSSFVFSGPTIFLFTFVLDSLNIRYNLTKGKFTSYGSRLPNGQWDGLVGAVQRKEADVILTAMVANYARQEVLAFSYTFLLSNMIIMGGSPPPTSRDITGLIMVFDFQVWIGLLISIIALIIVSSIRVYTNSNKVSIGRVPSQTFFNLVSDYIGASFLEGTPRDPVDGRSRILFAIWWLTMLVLANAFCGHFRSSMMVELEGEKVRDLPHLASLVHRITPVLWKGTAFEDNFKLGTTPELKVIWNAVVKANTARNSRDFYSVENLKKMTSGQEILINDALTMTYNVGMRCGLIDTRYIYKTQDQLFFFLSGFGFKKDIDPEILRKINKRILRAVESHLFHKRLEMEYEAIERCTGAALASSGPEERPLGLGEMGGIFKMWLFSLFLSFFGLLGELIFHFLNKKKATGTQ